MSHSQSSRDAIYRAILEDPESDTLRLNYADVCAAAGDHVRADFIRLQIEAAYRARAGRDDVYLASSEATRLLDLHKDAWVGPIGSRAARCSFFRGFVETIAIEPERFLTEAEDLCRLAPIRRLILHGVGAVPDELLKSPSLSRLAYFSLQVRNADDQGLKMIADSPHLRNLKWLGLGTSEITLGGLEALAASPNLPSLRMLDFTHTSLKKLAEDVGTDWDGTVTALWTSKEVEELERKHGRKTWLHPFQDNNGHLNEHGL